MRPLRQQRRPLRQAAAHPRIGHRAARRLLDSAQPATPHEQRLAELLAALAPRAEVREVPQALLAAFARSAAGYGADNQIADSRGLVGRGAGGSVHGGRSTDVRDAAGRGGNFETYAAAAGRGARGVDDHAPRRSGARLPRTGLLVRAAVVVVLLSCTTLVAAAADALPAPAQRIVHNLFGSLGVPAPHTSPSTSPAAPPEPHSSAPSTALPSPSPSPSAVPSLSASASAVSSPGSHCSAAETHAASEHCGPPATGPAAHTTGPAVHTTSPGQGVGKGHTPTAHGDIVH